MTQIKPSLLLVAGLAACSAPAREPEHNAAPADRSLSATTAPASGRAVNGPPHASAPSPAGTHDFVGADGLVRLDYADPLKPGHAFGGKALMAAGWRLMWDGKEAGTGSGVVSFAEDATPTSGLGYVTELVQIGMSRDAAVVAGCGTAGMQGPNTQRLPNRMLGGHRWTVWKNGDAGMSQQIDATDWRTVVNGACYAIDRASYYVKAADAKPGLPSQKVAAARIDAVLGSVRVGGH